MSDTSIFVCLEPRRSDWWQLGALPPSIGRMMLIGWKKDPEPVDGGVPEDVAPLLARAFTSIGRVTFLSSALHASTGGGWWPVKRAPGAAELTSTTDPQTSCRCDASWAGRYGAARCDSASPLVDSERDHHKVLVMTFEVYVIGAIPVFRTRTV